MKSSVSNFLVILAFVLAFAVDSRVVGQEKKPNTKTELDAEKFGFKISSPNDRWILQSTNPKPGSLMLKVSRKDAGGKIAVTVVAEPVALSDDQATKWRDAALEKTAGKNEFSNRNKSTYELAETEAPGFEIDWKVQGQSFRVHQCYLVNQDFVYTVAIHAPVDQFESLANTLGEIRNSFKFVRVGEEAKRDARLRRLIARCGSEVNWAQSWESASEQAKRDNKSILVLIRSQSGFDIADGVTTVAFMNQDVIEFLNEHCIVFRYEKGMKAPFSKYDKYGIGPSSFGNTVLLVEPNGTVFGDTFSFEPTTFLDFLLTSFGDRLKKGEPPKNLKQPIQLAGWYARRGAFASAIDHLGDLETAQAHRLRASIFRRQRNVDQARKELIAALAKSNTPGLRVELAIENTLLRLYSGLTSPVKARGDLEKLLKNHPNHERSAEMMYWIGLCQFAESKKSAAEETWMELINSFDEKNRWTWGAAAALKSGAFRMNVAPEFGLPSEDVIQAFRSIPFEQFDVAKIDQAEKEAIAYLLDTQRKDGSWISPPAALKAKGYNTSPFTIAITSICAKSLVPHRRDPDIARRIDRAFGFLVQSNRDAKKQPDKPYYMDYSPWADAYLLRFLASYVQTQPGKRQQIEPLVRDAVDALSRKQKPGGGWSYYISHTLGQANQPSNQSISFMTAAVTIALLETRKAGFEVSESLTDNALDCLERMRNPNETYTYFLWHEREGEGRLAGEEGAAGRGPVCSLALSMADRSGGKEIAACLDLFLKYQNLYSRERGKSLMHAAPGGQGSHYLMFDYAWAAAAAASLPAYQKKLYRDRLLETVLTSRSNQGSFLDNPINGWHYGTGMALEAMTLLR